MTLVFALTAGIALGVAVLLVGAAFAPPPPPPPRRAASSIGSTVGGERVAGAAVAGTLTMLATGWVLAGLAVAGLIVCWGRIFTSKRAATERRRLEAIAKWLEDIRDLVRGSGLSLEQALEQSAAAPPVALQDELSRLLARTRQGWELDHALLALADELGHPTADAAIAAILMAIGTSGARLVTAVTTLAEVARDEVGARERSDRLRSIYESSMRRLIVIATGIIGFLRITSAELLEPLRTPPGQAWLALPLVVWVACLWWLRRLSRYEVRRRYRLRSGLAVSP
jgi:Flp pilus assembly protein TadB